MKEAAIVVVVVVVISLAYTVALRNYHECRLAGFSRVYCASIHFIR